MGAAAIPLGLALGGAGASGLGTLLATREHNAYTRRLGRRAEEQADLERGRQAEYQAQSAETLGGAIDRFRGPQQGEALGEATAAREKSLGDLVTSGGQVPASGAASNVVKTDLARRLAQTVAKGRDEAKSLARVGARGDVSLGDRIALMMSGGRLGEINNFSRGSLNLLDSAQTGAMAGASRPGIFGDILSGIGKVGMMGGLAGMGGGFGAAPYGGTGQGAMMRGPFGTLRGGV